MIYKDYFDAISVRSNLPIINFKDNEAMQLDKEDDVKIFLDREKLRCEIQEIDFKSVQLHWLLILKKQFEELNRNFNDNQKMLVIITPYYDRFKQRTEEFFYSAPNHNNANGAPQSPRI